LNLLKWFPLGLFSVFFSFFSVSCFCCQFSNEPANRLLKDDKDAKLLEKINNKVDFAWNLATNITQWKQENSSKNYISNQDFFNVSKVT
jgi:hypothetical protein